MSPSAAALAAPSASAVSKSTSTHEALDRAVADVRAHAAEFALLPVAEKAKLVRALIPGIVAVSTEWVRAGCKAKGLDADSVEAAEEWLGGVGPTLRNARLLAESLEAIAAHGKPPLGKSVTVRPDGRTSVRVFPSSAIDAQSFAGFTVDALLQPGVDAARARALQASYYSKKDPQPSVCAVLGAGNVSSIPPMDVFYKMFTEGRVCVLKMNPVNEWVGPFLEKALSPLIDRSFLRIVYGGGEAGKHLVEHQDVDDIHITGSDKTHDLIVWGPPGPERERRKLAKDPVLKKSISSELGNVSPLVIVPGSFTESELDFQAASVATAITNNASFNCNAAKMLVLSKGWPQRERFLELLGAHLAKAKPRKAYYPGAQERYDMLTAGRARVLKFGEAPAGALPWTLVRDLDALDANERAFTTEPFCALVSEVALDVSEPAAFLAAATKFCNDTLWGTLNATIIIHPSVEKQPAAAAALDRAILDLRYGAVAINHWPGVVYGLVTPGWGGHPSATLEDIQSGLGWVHNTFMLEGIEKMVLRGPLKAFPRPAWFYDNKRADQIGERLIQMESGPSWLKFPGMVLQALRG